MWQPTNSVEQDRLMKVNELRARGVDLYPRRAQRTHSATQAIAAFEQAEAQDPAAAEQIQVTVAGRIRRANIKGKLSFMHYEDESGRLQLFMRVNDMDENVYNLIRDKLIDVDDFVQASGTMMRTKAGEVSVLVRDLTLLSKSLSPLPVIKRQTLEDGTIRAHGEYSDTEARYRQRYADLAVNEEVRAVFRKRARIVRAMQNFLDDEGMLEVETPILQPIYGGAAARPFTTHHNHLKQDLFLRISFELYLKRLLTGGYNAVYEIGRDFRNEGVSWKHNPEFTMMEFYKAYIDYTGVMDIVERMTATIAKEVTGSTKVVWGDKEIELAPPWRRVTIREIVREYTGIDYMDYPDAASLAAVLLDKLGEHTPAGESWGRMVVERLLGNHVEKHLIQPTFIMDYPRDMSPFAKPTEYDTNHTERFEVFIGGMEMGNAFTELNDPFDQESRFLEMASAYRKGSDEETPYDEDYLQAMRYGMPPMGGFGMGIDRLVMLLTNHHSIRDVLLFPHLRLREDMQE
jgi:lysyl-tRNA synthetase class 2